MSRLRFTGAVLLIPLLIGGEVASRGLAEARAGDRATPPAGLPALQLFYTPPVLVRAGQPVRIPVDVVCVGADAGPCAASVAMWARAESEGWRRATARAIKGLRFDLTAPAVRAAGPGGSGRVDFFLTAMEGGRSTTLGSTGRPLAFFVARDLSVVRLPRMGGERRTEGRTVLSLPWGSGPSRAGLQAGLESATLGPSSFDVGEGGRIHLVDGLQRRVAVFDRGRMVEESPLAGDSPADIALTADGTTYLGQRESGEIVLRTTNRRGGAPPVRLGRGILSQVRASGNSPAVNLLPMGAWASGLGRGPSSAKITTGRPLADGTELLVVATERFIRIGRLEGDHVVGAIELTSSEPLGDVPLVEPFGPDGLVVVVHRRDEAGGQDRYQVVRLQGSVVRVSFAVGGHQFAQGLPFSRFRLAGGCLFQMTSNERGFRIIRYRL